MKVVLAITAVSLRRLFRDRTNIFFVLLFPLLLILLLGVQFGGSFVPRVGVVDADGSPASAAVREALAEEELELVDVADEEALVADVESGELAAGVSVPAGFGAALRAGDPVEVGWLARPDGTGIPLQTTASSALTAVEGRYRAARVLASVDVVDDVGAGLDLVRGVSGGGVVTEVEQVGTNELAEEFAGLGQFDLVATTQLVLFVFVTSLAAAASVIQARNWGLLRRIAAGPVRSWQVVAGIGAGRLAVALTQAGLIIVGTALLFDVGWGDPLAVGVVVLFFSLVSAGAAMLVGAVLSDDAQAGGLGVPVGLGLSALGGCMLPLELFPETLRRIAFVTPHAWANTAFAEILRRDGTVVDVLGQVGVLAAYAVVLLAIASWMLGRRTAAGR